MVWSAPLVRCGGIEVCLHQGSDSDVIPCLLWNVRARDRARESSLVVVVVVMVVVIEVSLCDETAIYALICVFLLFLLALLRKDSRDGVVRSGWSERLASMLDGCLSDATE